MPGNYCDVSQKSSTNPDYPGKGRFGWRGVSLEHGGLTMNGKLSALAEFGVAFIACTHMEAAKGEG